MIALLFFLMKIFVDHTDKIHLLLGKSTNLKGLIHYLISTQNKTLLLTKLNTSVNDLDTKLQV